MTAASDEDQMLEKLLIEWNETRVEYPKDKTVQELFEEQVERTPENIAVIYGDEQLTYRALNERANQVAHYLKKKGVGRETLVGVSLNRSIELIVGILGVLKAGGAYVPLDPEYPEERLQFMLEDTEAPVLITSKGLQDRFRGYRGVFLLLDDEGEKEELANISKKNFERVSRGEDLAYVIYTSGSTGQPKGVMIEHKALYNQMMWLKETYGFSNERVLQRTSIAFDASVWEILIALITNSTLVFYQNNGHFDEESLIKEIYVRHITVLQVVPSILKLLLVSQKISLCKSLQYVFAGGEALEKETISNFETLFDIPLYNLYGPTEVTINSIYTKAKKHKNHSLIGKPISNTSIYILDEGRKPVPIGAVGEIYIGGAGLARGYLNRPELTAERFIENPFVSDEDKRRGENLRLYRTGDLGRYLADGNVEYMGRIDDQVKIRGYRIELGEIESTLNSCGEVHSSVVVTRSVDQNGTRDKRLVAYVVPEEELKSQFVSQGTFRSSTGDEIGILGGEHYAEGVRGLKERLGKKLPEYMVPSAIVFMEKVPLTHNGKVDKKALPAPDMDMIVAQQYVGPRDEVEQRLCEIWAEVLGLERVGIHDNFFEIGGHSLLLVTLFTKLRKLFPLSNFSLIGLFENTTIAKTANLFNYNSSRSSFIFPICLNDNDSGSPLFLIHPAGGLALEYLDLKRYIHNKNIYGINNPFFGTQNTFSSIEEMPTYYIEEIQKISPNGPYILGGYSFGGLVAYQIAHHLTSAGIEVSNVLLIDTAYCTFSGNISFEKYLEDVNVELAQLEDNDLKREREKAEFLYYFYNPPIYEGHVTLIKATEPPLEQKDYIIEAYDNHWQKLLKSPRHIQVRSATRCKFSLKASRGVNHPKDFLGVVL